MPRLFTGIELPQTQRTMLSLAQSGLPNARWIEQEDMHITLRLMGDVERRRANDIVDALRAKSWNQPTIQLGELRAFGGSKPSSVHASIADDPILTRLQAAQETLICKLGLPEDHRKFTPHVTLARCRQATAEQVAHYLGQFGGFSAPRFQPTSYVLYSAKESVGGGPYYVEERFPLTANEG